jgi:RimJ/RimL family protein N-acetyltransferase
VAAVTDIDLQPHLAGSVVTLDPLTGEDWPALYAAASDPLIWAAHPAHDRWREPVFRSYFEQALASGGALTVRDTASGAVIGSSRYDLGRAGPGEVEIGWTFLARSAWGGPVNAAMKRLMIGHALRRFDRVIFLVGEHNGRSRRAMEKIGGVLTDRTQDTIIGDTLVRHVVYAIDRPGFAAGPLS